MKTWAETSGHMQQFRDVAAAFRADRKCYPALVEAAQQVRFRILLCSKQSINLLIPARGHKGAEPTADGDRFRDTRGSTQRRDEREREAECLECHEAHEDSRDSEHGHGCHERRVGLEHRRSQPQSPAAQLFEHEGGDRDRNRRVPNHLVLSRLL